MISGSNIQMVDNARNAMANALRVLPDAGSGAGTIAIYAGDIPATAATAITTQTLLGTLTLSDPAFGAASGGVCTASAITADSSADAAGTIAFGRVRDSTGATCFDLRAGVDGSGAGLIVAAATTVVGLPIEVVSLSFTFPSGS